VGLFGYPLALLRRLWTRPLDLERKSSLVAMPPMPIGIDMIQLSLHGSPHPTWWNANISCGIMIGRQTIDGETIIPARSFEDQDI
jgi:hypothetical protein